MSGTTTDSATPRSAGTGSPEEVERQADRRRLGFRSLLFLAAGGVIGSGWMLGGVQADLETGSWAAFSWLIGGGLMLVIAAVMVVLSTAAPKTGGMIFLPLQSNGPLLATVVAAGLWTFYAVNPASEAVAMTHALAAWSCKGALLGAGGDSLSALGLAWAVGLMLLVTAANLFGPRRFLAINNILTAFKLLVPMLVVVLLGYAVLNPSGRQIQLSAAAGSCLGVSGSSVLNPHNDLGSVLTTVTSSGVIYAYLGFQGPLDFAGSVRRAGIGEAARLRRAVYGTVCGSILLYVALQFVVVYIQHRPHTGQLDASTAPYAAFAQGVAPLWAARAMSFLINLDSVLSPAGAAMVFTYVLTREVAALSRAHLTHRGLQKTRYSVIRVRGGQRVRAFFGDRLDVYWLILIVDFCVSAVAMLGMFLTGGDWSVLSSITSILALVVYATPSVVLAALHRQRRREHREDVATVLLPMRHRVLAEAAFVSIAVIFLLAGWDRIWPGMAALIVACVVLFGMPKWAEGRRWYDARLYAPDLLKLKGDHSYSARSAYVLFGFFGVTTLVALLNRFAWSDHPVVVLCTAIPVAVLAVTAFHWLVRLSEHYMREHEPVWPTPMPVVDVAELGLTTAEPSEA